MTSFVQDGPRLGNPYTDDSRLRRLLRRRFEADEYAIVDDDLRRFGRRLLAEIEPLAADAEQNEPRLVSFSPWGERIDRIETSAGWKALDRVSAEEGLVAIGYERRFGARSRLYQFAKLYLFHPSSAIYTCPLAMTDGAARLIEAHGPAWLRDEAYGPLTSRDPHEFWTSGQWMTERTGGSDVGQSRTRARAVPGSADEYLLEGDKWFTSAATSQIAMTLARIEGADGRVIDGSRGLSLFYLRTHDDQGRKNGIVIHRLKDKLGTRAMPTAELTLAGTRARRVGEVGQGIKTIATMMNITRVYNAICAVASMRRSLSLARDYAARRIAFGKSLAEQPLHAETLADLEVELAGAFHLVFRVVELLGADEVGGLDGESAATLRLLIPLTKLFTARRCVPFISECLEAFGGAGYIEDTGLPRLLRDSQVLPIWEGTTNILSLDSLRAIATADALRPTIREITERLASVAEPALRESIQRLSAAASEIEDYALKLQRGGSEVSQAGARAFAIRLAWVYAGSLLLEEATFAEGASEHRHSVAVARRWVAKPPASLLPTDPSYLDESRLLAAQATYSPVTPSPARP